MTIQKKSKIVCNFLWYIIIIVALSIVSASIYDPYSVKRGNEEGVIWLDANVIEQPVEFVNTDHLAVIFLTSNDDLYRSQNIFCIEIYKPQQKEPINTFEISLNSLRKNDWNLKHIFINNLSGKFLIKFSLKKFDDGNIGLLLTSGNQPIKLEHAIINGLEKSQFVQFSYKNFSYLIFGAFLLFYSCLFLIILLFYYSIILFARKQIHSKSNNYMSLLFFCFINMFYFIKYFDNLNANDNWINSYFLPNFADGGIRKSFIGTIYQLFISETVYKKDLLLVYHCTFIMLVITCLIIFRLFTKSASVNKIGNSLILLYAAFPFSISFYFVNYGRVDEYLLMLFAFSVILIYYNKALLVFILTTTAITIHQRYIFTIYPCLLIIMLFNYNSNKSLKNLFSIVLNILIPGIIGYYVQFISKVDYQSLGDYMSVLNQRAKDFSVVEAFVSCEFFLPTSENAYIYGILDQKEFYCRLNLILFLSLISPILYSIMGMLYRLAKRKKLYFFAILTVILAVVPMFMTISDYGRIMTEFSFAVFILLLFMINKNNNFRLSFFAYIRYLKHTYGRYITLFVAMYFIFLGIGRRLYIDPDIVVLLRGFINNLYLDFYDNILS